MIFTRLLILPFIFLSLQNCKAQADSIATSLWQLPGKYITRINNKIDKYSSRINSKTEKTLTRLSRWENKIQSLLQKVNPEVALRLFGNDQTTFSTLLLKIKEGKSIAGNYKARYDDYRDKLTTSMTYLQEQKDKLKNNIAQPLAKATKKITELEEDVKNSEALEQFIKERKKQLINESVKYIGNSKYLTKINKEAYYYVETLRNYKEIFSDKKKAEEKVLRLLNDIPAFQKFYQQNSQLASLFGLSTNFTNPQNLIGLQTRASVQSLIQTRIAAGGPNAQQMIRQNFQSAQAQLTQLKDKVLKAGGSNSNMEIPDFKPNLQKTKTILQRLEYGGNLQFGRNNSLVPTTADIGLSVGYKLNDKSLVGIGASYKMGLGTLQHLRITHQGIGLRSFVDWKIKKQLYMSGGFEMNYNAVFKSIRQIQNYTDWQQACLIGLTKKMNIKTKWFNGTKLQLLYDMFYTHHTPVSQPVLFRLGYNFKN